MESEAAAAADALETEPKEIISGSFICCVCLELLYKPIVLPCGHMSCFWCVNRCMDGGEDSRCPTCRQSYYHFPSICQMLHFLLWKMYPITYKIRETRILEYEKARDCFSPELKNPECASQNSEKLCHLGHAGQSYPRDTKEYSSSKGSSRDARTAPNLKALVFSSSIEGVCKYQLRENSSGDLEVTQNHAVEENVMSERQNGRVTITDMLCVACNELLFRPIVINCGHVYCESCITIPDGETFRCLSCQSFHPYGIPKVCLELHHFLETRFPTEYELQKNTIKQVGSQQESLTICMNKNFSHTRGSAKGSKRRRRHFSFSLDDNFCPSWGEHNGRVHFGVGCDFCGMYPILGNRYKCKDCMNVMGFDLCGDCYTARLELPGRFNQQHTPEHRLEIVDSESIHDRIFRLMIRGEAENFTGAPVIPETDVEIPQNLIAPAAGEENGENELVSLPTSPRIIEEQSGEQSPPTM